VGLKAPDGSWHVGIAGQWLVHSPTSLLLGRLAGDALSASWRKPLRNSAAVAAV